MCIIDYAWSREAKPFWLTKHSLSVEAMTGQNTDVVYLTYSFKGGRYVSTVYDGVTDKQELLPFPLDPVARAAIEREGLDQFVCWSKNRRGMRMPDELRWTLKQVRGKSTLMQVEMRSWDCMSYARIVTRRGGLETTRYVVVEAWPNRPRPITREEYYRFTSEKV